MHSESKGNIDGSIALHGKITASVLSGLFINIIEMCPLVLKRSPISPKQCTIRNPRRPEQHTCS